MKRLLAGAAAMLVTALAFSAGPEPEWQPVPAPKAEGLVVRLLAVDSEGTWYLGTRAHGVFRSKDRGAHWDMIGLEGKNIGRLRIGPKDCLLTVINDDKVDSQSRVWRWDKGAGRTEKVTGIDVTLTADFVTTKDGLVVAGVAWSGRTYVSADGGRTFKATVKVHEKAGIYTVGQDAQGNLWAGTEDQGMFISKDGAKSWTPAGTPLSNVQGFVLTGAGVLLAGGKSISGEAAGIYRYTGAEWKPSAKGIPDSYQPGDKKMNGRCLHLGSDGRVYALTETAAWRSDDGTSWENVSAGLPEHLHSGQLATDKDGSLLAVISGQGIYRMALPAAAASAPSSVPASQKAGAR